MNEKYYIDRSKDKSLHLKLLIRGRGVENWGLEGGGLA
jgi:hypothetical protein